MALINRIGEGALARFKERNCIISSKDKIVRISATMSLSESYTVQVTNHQLEDGSNITDHGHFMPPVFTLDCIISNDDFDYTNPLNLIYDTGEQVKEQLIEFAKKIEKLEIRYKDKVFTGYIITSFTPSQDTSVGDNYIGNVSFQQFNIATAASGTIVKGKQPVQAKPVKKSILKGVFG